MSGFPIVDLVIGIVFVYFLLSIISSSAVEIVLTLVEARAKILEAWLKRIFNEPVGQKNGKDITLGQAIMDHCAAIALAEPGKAPSYIDAKNFTAALFERITYDEKNPKSIATDINGVITTLENTKVLSTEIQRALLSYAYDAQATYAKISGQAISEIEYFKAKVENWFDTSMDRLTGTFKRKYTQPLTFIVAAITVLLLNADSIAISKYLYSNPEARAKIVAQAYNAASDSTYLNRLQQIRTSRQDSATLESIKNNIHLSLQNINEANAALTNDIPIGWKSEAKIAITPAFVLTKITGLLATILATFMGAPFWFDILNKVANLRGTGPKPPSSTGSDSNDSKDKKS